MDGYLGWPLAQYLASRSHEVAGADALLRRSWVEEVNAVSAIPIASIDERLYALRAETNQAVPFWRGDLQDYGLVERIFLEFEPEAIIHLGECSSDPYSMIDRKHTVFAQVNNLTTTFNLLFAVRDLAPRAHVVKLGTLPGFNPLNADIPEGYRQQEHREREDLISFPEPAPDSIMLACRIWGIRATNVRQGVVFGTRAEGASDDPRMRTRLDFDRAFGTVINRLSCRAVIGHPLIPDGVGGQVLASLPLGDSMQCLTLCLEQPPEPGEYQILNQPAETHSLDSLATVVHRAALDLGLKLDTPPVEYPGSANDSHMHHAGADQRYLGELGYRPTRDVVSEVRSMLQDLLPYRERIAAHQAALLPGVRENGSRHRARSGGEVDQKGDW